MIKQIILLSSIITISSVGALVVKEKGLSQKDKKQLSNVKIEKGGIIVLEQHFKNANNYNGKDRYQVSFTCEKISRNRTKCSVDNYNIYSTNKIR